MLKYMLKLFVEIVNDFYSLSILARGCFIDVWQNPEYKSSCSQMFFKKGVLNNLAKFTEKYLCWSLLFNKVTGLRSVILLEQRLQHMCFPVNFAEFLRPPFSPKTSGGCFCEYASQFLATAESLASYLENINYCRFVGSFWLISSSSFKL